MGVSLKGWESIFIQDHGDLFDGTDKSIERLTIMISDGRTVDGGVPHDLDYTDNTKHEEKKTEATQYEKDSVEDGFL